MTTTTMMTTTVSGSSVASSSTWLILMVQAACLWLVTLGRCTDGEVKSLLESCDPELAAINWNILANTDGNYTETCRRFSQYILCVEPGVQSCKSVLLHDYQANKAAYSDSPYNCVIPEVPYRLVRAYQDRMINNSVLLDNLHTMFSAGSHSAVSRTWRTILIATVAVLMGSTVSVWDYV